VALWPDRHFVAVSVGDSSAAILKDGRWLPVFMRSDEVFANSVPSSLPSDHPQLDLISGTLPYGSPLLVMTDGLSVPLGTPEVSAYLARRWEAPPMLSEFLFDLSFERRGESDDRTAVCVWVDAQERMA
jgi:serine/threonine protein phosphatase PrpC